MDNMSSGGEGSLERIDHADEVERSPPVQRGESSLISSRRRRQTGLVRAARTRRQEQRRSKAKGGGATKRARSNRQLKRLKPKKFPKTEKSGNAKKEHSGSRFRVVSRIGTLLRSNKSSPRRTRATT